MNATIFENIKQNSPKKYVSTYNNYYLNLYLYRIIDLTSKEERLGVKTVSDKNLLGLKNDPSQKE
jgi:hypothetical protein